MEEPESALDRSVILTSYSLMNSILGTSFVTLPFAIHQSGIWGGIFSLLVIPLATAFTLKLLVRVALSINKKRRAQNEDRDIGCCSYPELLHSVFGPGGFILGSVLILLFDFGAMCVFLVVLGDTLPSCFFYFFNTTFFSHRTIALLVAFPVTFSLCCVRKMDRLWFSSLISDLCAALLLVVFVIASFQQPSPSPIVAAPQNLAASLTQSLPPSLDPPRWAVALNHTSSSSRALLAAVSTPAISSPTETITPVSLGEEIESSSSRALLAAVSTTTISSPAETATPVRLGEEIEAGPAWVEPPPRPSPLSPTTLTLESDPVTVTRVSPTSATRALSWFYTTLLPFFQAIASVAYVYCCHDVTFALYESLADRSPRRWAAAVSVSIAASFSVLTTFTMMTLYTFGSRVQPNILENLPSGALLTNVAKLFLSFNMLSVFPMATFVARDTVFQLHQFVKRLLLRRARVNVASVAHGHTHHTSSVHVHPSHPSHTTHSSHISHTSHNSHNTHVIVSPFGSGAVHLTETMSDSRPEIPDLQFYGATLCLTTPALLISLWTRQIADAVEVCGGLTGIPLAFVLPPLCALKVSGSDLSWFQKLVLVLILAGGILVTFVIASQSFGFL
eukprot:TRINITY_DN9657_c0_g1_i2.p1 TRINITY_DN9657_c0_g1~~TRINITY_DN9657_c0_g1_i2.p1  ORF type:complete len:619 (-),score=71.79 TRINITY_DN9657_c0_g1_i2:209-2065(-)